MYSVRLGWLVGGWFLIFFHQRDIIMDGEENENVDIYASFKSM